MTIRARRATVLSMDTRKHETEDVAPPKEWGSEAPFSWLRKRNQRRARVAVLMQDSDARRANTNPVQRGHDRRHGR